MHSQSPEIEQAISRYCITHVLNLKIARFACEIYELCLYTQQQMIYSNCVARRMEDILNPLYAKDA